MTKEIDFIKLSRLFFAKRKLIFIAIIAGGILGVVIALLMANSYMSRVTFIPEINGSADQAGRVNRLASLAGLNLGSMTGETSQISPNLYPEIAESVGFRLELLNSKIKIQGVDDSVTYREYYNKYYVLSFFEKTKKYTLGLPKTILNALRKTENSEVPVSSLNGLKRISQQDLVYLEKVKGQLTVQLNEEIGLVNIGFVMPEAEASAIMTKHAADLLQSEVIAYKLSKVQQELTYTNSILKEQQKKLNIAERQLANFIDSNFNLTTEKARNERKKLEAVYDLEYQIYSELVSKVKELELRQSQDMPVFTTINEIVIPNQKFKPNRPLVVLASVFISVILALGWIFASYKIKS